MLRICRCADVIPPPPAYTDTVLPQLKSTVYDQGHILLFIPSYFDYVRVRNYCKTRHLSVVHACEYTKNAELSRGRSAFYHGEWGGDVHIQRVRDVLDCSCVLCVSCVMRLMCYV